ncbi:uncharacterized protein B0I36DRAFT_359108 [Microdochium trichocladiopsis]|uniref:Uncharacterized protein n=1 Tax=Microdochium trichocladiopsis TaxID=1682393 RepID=A0A9P9BTV7_9PEZI|nr:uncharacterized protein B0I36DRAFT_359108 [Microdochium trichocladiopsis]KAH7037407.1 hypothetical protein B0I36DRAFT_359108 [Microdochium trichocladiopsis]
MQTFATAITSFLLSALAIQTASAGGIVVTPVFANQVVPKVRGDCAWGVVTPQGCAPLRS